MAEATFHTNPVGYSPTASVTVQRTTPGGIIDITVAFMHRGHGWFITHILDEDGNDLVLTPIELILATSLVEAGVDETGR